MQSLHIPNSRDAVACREASRRRHQHAAVARQSNRTKAGRCSDLHYSESELPNGSVELVEVSSG